MRFETTRRRTQLPSPAIESTGARRIEQWDAEDSRKRHR
jgi:hypothetical protein